MKKIFLDGSWKMQGGGYSVCGNIPGSVYSFLHIDNDILPDPHFGENEDIYLALANEEFVFDESDAVSYRQLGNSVNVKLVKIFAEELFKL